MPDHPGEWRRVLKMLAGSPEGVTGSPMPAAKRWGADNAERSLPRPSDDGRQHAGAGLRGCELLVIFLFSTCCCCFAVGCVAGRTFADFLHRVSLPADLLLRRSAFLCTPGIVDLVDHSK
jgi:hypothetical protein